jgi:SAM-dependent methyltransferase
MSKTSLETVPAACCEPDCCGSERSERPATADVQAVVREKYGNTAKGGLSSDHDGVRAVAEAFGYSTEELSSIPAEANMGLSCGNPTATANLRPGEVVVDLGSGGGLDVFLAARKVGPRGKAIGIDMTPEMIELSKKNAAKDGLTNVEFHLASIDQIPLREDSVDVVISNCVINLAPDKSAVFREIARVLKPGGRVAVSDIALHKPLPEEIAKDVMAYVGCISGALLIDDYRRLLSEAGFADVVVVDAGADLNAYRKVEGQSGCCSPAASPVPERSASSSACCSPAQSSPVGVRVSTSTCCGPSSEGDQQPETVHGGLSDLLRRHDVNEYAASVRVFAVKPQA